MQRLGTSPNSTYVLHSTQPAGGASIIYIERELCLCILHFVCFLHALHITPYLEWFGCLPCLWSDTFNALTLTAYHAVPWNLPGTSPRPSGVYPLKPNPQLDLTLNGPNLPRWLDPGLESGSYTGLTHPLPWKSFLCLEPARYFSFAPTGVSPYFARYHHLALITPTRSVQVVVRRTPCWPTYPIVWCELDKPAIIL